MASSEVPARGRSAAGPVLHWPGKPTPEAVLEGLSELRPRFRLAERYGPESPDAGQLFWGENLHVAAHLLERWRGRMDLIYIDPPFGLQRSLRVRWGAHPEDPVAYEDRWPDGLTGYLQMLYPRLVLIRELLSDRGSLYVHLGPQVAPYVRVLLDELFGPGTFRNEIIWRRDAAGKGGKRGSPQWPRNTESILFYTRRPKGYHFTQLTRPLSPEQAAAYRLHEPDGRRFRAVQLGNYTEASIRRLQAEGRIYVSPSGKRYKKYYLDEARATVDCIWTDLPGFGTRTAAKEHVGYPGQKPEALLERILLASSRPGDVVADLFCGAGTTLVVAQRLGRRWIGCDLSPLAIQACRRRLGRPGGGPFEIWWEEAPTPCGAESGAPPVAVEASCEGSQARVRIVGLPDEPPPPKRGRAPNPPVVDGWAVDGALEPAFTPLWQAFAPVRASEPPLPREAVVELPAGARGVRVQVVDGAGRLYRLAASLGGLPSSGGWTALTPAC